jgi:plastocyanin
METQETRPPTPDLSAQAPRLKRRTRGPLGQLTLIAFVGYILMHFVLFSFTLLVEGILFPPILLFAGFLLPFAGLLATRWRFATLPAALVSLLNITFLLLQPHNLYVLSHPAQSEFIVSVPFLAFGLVAGIAGVWATVENYRGGNEERHSPRFLGRFLSGLAGLVVGMVLVALLVAATPQTGAVRTSPNGEPAVHMTPTTFAPNVVLAPTGSSLQIVADSSAKHILDYGRWDASGVAHPLSEPGAPPLHDMVMTGGSMELGPFTTPGVYHIYCTIHQGMNLTIVVE